jgi:hypothetical protein
MVANDVRLVTFVEVLIPQLTVWDFVTDDEVCRLHNTVRDHDRRPLLAFPAGKPAKFGAEIRPVRVARGVRTFDEDCPEPLIPFAGPPTPALASTLIVPWAYLGPRTEMLRGRKLRHIDPYFRDQVLGGPLTHARDGVQEGDRLGVRAT